MESSALEAKINKIRQQNEEIRRRHQEVEEDKKNAAKLNALVQMVPTSVWPERKEPPEFSNPPKPKPIKMNLLPKGEGPPPDPKYNFLADSEREEPSAGYSKESSGNRAQNRVTRGNFKKKTFGRDPQVPQVYYENKVYKWNCRRDTQPGYDAWRAERNRIDEDRISRQRTAEGNWRREWDNDKMHIIDDVTKKATRSTLGDFTKKDTDRKYHSNNTTEYVGAGSRPHRGSSKNFYGNYDDRSYNAYDPQRNNAPMPAKPLSPTSEERTVIATDKSIKVTVNQSNATSKAAGPVMSVKVNSPSIAGTGRVGPRQRTRVTYSHSDAEVSMPENEPFHRQKSFEEKPKGAQFGPKSPNVKRSHSQKKKESEIKYRSDFSTVPVRFETNFRPYGPKPAQKSQTGKSPKPIRKIVKPVEQSSNFVEKEQFEECSNIEPDVIIENNEITEMLQSIDPDQPESLRTEISQPDIKREEELKVNDCQLDSPSQLSETKKQVSVEEANAEETSTVSLPGIVDPDSEIAEQCTKDVEEEEEEEEVIVPEKLQDNPQEIGSSASSEVMVPSNDDSESVPDKRNHEESRDTAAMEKASSNEEKQSLQHRDKQINEDIEEQLANNDCDKTRDEEPAESSGKEPSFEVETHSVINVVEDHQLVLDDRSAGEKILADQKDQCSVEKIEDGPKNIVGATTTTTTTTATRTTTTTTTTDNPEKVEDMKQVSEKL